MILTLYRVVAPFVALSLPLVALFNRKVRAGLSLRTHRPEPPRFTEAPLWIHVASGEFEYAKPVIRELKALRPGAPVVVTYFSPTYAAQVINFPGVDYAEALPLDLPGPVAAFLDRIKPRACVIARTDFWPELLTQAGRRGIPRIVFAYTQRPVTGLKALFSRAQLSLVDEVWVVSEADRAATARLRPDLKIEVLGDPRFDQVAARLAHPRALSAGLRPRGPTLVAGSTWPADEAVLLPAVAPLLKDRRLSLILVPHEPTPAHLTALTDALDRISVTYSLYSRADVNAADKHVLLVDQTGVLAELYAWGEFAFVGGSFRARVHSVMEALGTGAITFVGPRITNNREAVEFAALALADGPGLNVIQNSKELHAGLAGWLARPRQTQALAVRAEFERRRGAAAAIARRLSRD